MSDDIQVTVDGRYMRSVPLPRSGGCMLATESGDQAIAVNDELTVRVARESVADLLGHSGGRFPSRANGVLLTSSAMPASGASMWLEPPDMTVFTLNEDLQLRTSEPHAAQQLGHAAAGGVTASAPAS